MALDDSFLKKIDLENHNIKNNCGILNKSLNTFQYVTKSLNEWANETVIGSEIKQNSQTLSDNLKELLEKTKLLYNQIDKYIKNKN